MTTRKVVVGSVTVATIVTVLLLVMVSLDADAPSTVGKLTCAPGELVGTSHSQINPAVPGASTPQAALQKGLAAEMPSLEVSAVKLTTSGSDIAEYAYADGSKTVATFKVVNAGGWHYDGYVACESFLRTFFRSPS